MTGVTAETEAAMWQQAGMDFVSGLVPSDDDGFRRAFSHTGENPDELTHSALIERADGVIGVLANRLLLKALPVYNLPPGSTGEFFPAVGAGWAKLEPDSAVPGADAPDKARPHTLKPTEAGLLAIKGWRQARGHSPLEEA